MELYEIERRARIPKDFVDRALVTWQLCASAVQLQLQVTGAGQDQRGVVAVSPFFNRDWGGSKKSLAHAMDHGRPCPSSHCDCH